MTLFFFSPWSFSQDQNQLAILIGLKNLMQATYRPIQRLLTPDPLQLNECRNSETFSDNDFKWLIDPLDHIAKNCTPWSENPSCGCELVCPSDYRILNSPFYQGKNISEENEFSFRNDPDEFLNTKYKMTQGYCWGHAVGTQRFNRLAVFGAEGDVRNKKGRKLSKGSAEYEKEIKKRIRSVFKNKVAEFPDFKNLKQLSSTPPYDVYIKNLVAKTWASEAINFENSGLILNAKPKFSKTFKNRLNDIIERSDKGLVTQLTISAKDFPGFIHTVLVQSYSRDEKTGVVTLCIQDSNTEIEENIICKNKLIFNPRFNGYQVKYNRWNVISEGEIQNFKVGSNEDLDLSTQIKSLRRYCQLKLCKKKNRIN